MPETENIIQESPVTTSQEEVSGDFIKDLKISPITTPEPVNPFAPIAEKPVETTTEKKPEETVKAEGQATIENTTKTTIPEEQVSESEFVVTDEDLGSILTDATEGAIKTVSELHTIIDTNRQLQDRIKELETNPLLAFKDEKQASIAKFLMDYKGGDYHTGIQTYARLQSLDIPNMKPEQALKEVYVMDKSRQGISRTDAEEMFDIEFDRKYSDYGDKAEKFIAAEAFEARKKLQEAKQAFTVEPKKDDDQSVQQEQLFREQREKYEKSVHNAFENEKGEKFKQLIIAELTDNPEHDFVYDVENTSEIKESLMDFQTAFNQRYGLDNGGFNAELMKMDQTIIKNFSKISRELFKHGETIGYEKAIMERQNIPKKTEQATTQHANAGGGIPQTFHESLMGAKPVYK